jgi:hypothetical protein
MAGIFQLGLYDMGFDMDPTAAQIFTQFAGGSASATTPFSFGFSWSVGGTAGGILLGTNLTTLIIGARIFISTLPAAHEALFLFYDATLANTQVSLHVNATGQLQFYLGGNGSSTLIGTASSAGTIAGGAWAYVECTVTISATVGFVECKVNGTTVITTAATQNTKNTANTFVNALQLIGAVGVATCLFDDWYMLDGTGIAPFNAYLGPVQVRGDAPSANSAVGGRNAFTPTNPTNVNWTNVGNIPAVATKYNADSTAGDYDMFQFPSLPANTLTVLAVDLWALVLLDSAGARTVELNTYSNPTDSPTAAFTPGTTAAYANQVSTVDPHGPTAWTVATAGAAELGVKVQT